MDPSWVNLVSCEFPESHFPCHNRHPKSAVSKQNTPGLSWFHMVQYALSLKKIIGQMISGLKLQLWQTWHVNS